MPHNVGDWWPEDGNQGLSKSDVNYREGEWPKQCDSCISYLPPGASKRDGLTLQRSIKYKPNTPGTCEIVHGRIHPKGLCDAFRGGKGKDIWDDGEELGPHWTL